MLFGLLSLSASVALFSILPQIIEDKNIQISLQRSSIFTSGFGWICLASFLLNHFEISQSLGIPFIALPYAAILMVTSFKGVSDGRLERTLAAVVSVLAVILQVIAFPGVLTFTFALMTSILILSYGFVSQQKSLFFGGLLGVGVSLINHLRFALILDVLNPWISLAILGAITIVAAAYAEKHFPRIATSIKSLHGQISAWK